MTTDERIGALAELGSFLGQFSEAGGEREESPWNAQYYDDLQQLIETVNIYNPWFSPENVRTAMAAVAKNLEKQKLEEWIAPYRKQLAVKKPLRVAVIMAGNIPMVGFHDMLCVLVSGNKFCGKLSSDDKLLLPFISKVLISIQPAFAGYIEFTEERLKGIDAVIATGSNNSARYFDYYFGKYPHIIRKNRNSVAVLTGKESVAELRGLGNDVFQYFGLGCRNVSKIFVPAGYDFDVFYSSIVDFGSVVQNNKYMNNYEYNRTVYLMSSDPTLLDNNFLLLKEDASYASPVGMLFYEYYDDVNVLNTRLQNERAQIQCIVSGSSAITGAIPFGTAQCPALADYADGVDTMKFLTEL
ncbi:MAG: acyl-CoA reductase [Bacteroidetes bacterium]|nr:acyl-CoA reductase [Bacteroidota bacterium]